MSLTVEFFAQNFILHAKLSGSRKRLGNLQSVGILFDKRYFGEVQGKRDGSTTLNFSVPLPAETLADHISLIDLETGESLLPQPYPIADIYQLRMAEVAVGAARITGGFSVLGLPERVWIDFRDDSRIVARGFARRRHEGGAPVYAFDLPIIAMVPPRQETSLIPRIAGKVVSEAEVTITAEQIGYVGFVDGTVPGTVYGWATRLGGDEACVSVDLLLDGEVIDTIVADGFRDDIRKSGFGSGYCSFAFAIPANDAFSQDREVSIVISGTRLQLLHSPSIVKAKPPLRGSFDILHGMSAHGWALNEETPKKPVVVEAVSDGVVLATATAKLFRADLLDASLAGGYCAFKIDIGTQFLDLLGKEISVRIQDTGVTLEGSPKVASQNPNLLRYLRPRRDVPFKTIPRLRRMMDRKVAEAGRLSIIMPVYNTPRDWLLEALESVCQQWCTQWELVCIDDCSTEPHIQPILQAYARRDKRIRVLKSLTNLGIARSVNLGLRAATGDYVTFIDHDDYLEPDAVYHLLRAIQTSGADFLYSDEAVTEENINSISEVRARPAFSYDYYLSHPYFVHMLCLKRLLAYEIGGWDESMTISADVDFVLRIIETAKTIVHVPRVLYRWRTHGSSTGHAKKQTVMDATRRAIQSHLDRRETGATVEDGVWFNQFRINWPASDGRILIVIPTKNKADLIKTAVESIERTSLGIDYKIVVVDHQSDEPESMAYFADLAKRHTVMPYKGPFNYSRINNTAVTKHGAGCDFVLLLNNDVEAIQDGWLDRMRRLAHRPDVGGVGALLLYPDKRIQHAGVIFGFNGSADHAFKFETAYLDDKGRRNLGYNCSLSATRDYSAVTAACLMMRMEVFRTLGGFDEDFAVGFNDTDLCLRVREAGLKILYDGDTILFHYESATRSLTKQIDHPEDTTRLLDRHDYILKQVDPFYNPNLSHVSQDHVLREDTGCKSYDLRETATPGAVAVAVAAGPPKIEVAPPRKARRRTA